MRVIFPIRATFAAVFCLGVLAAPVRAENSCPIPLSLTLSGGVSLGAYQAGFLYYIGQILRQNPGLFEPKIITGSSAGGINTILSIFTLCSDKNLSPTESDLWQAWIELQTSQLLAPIEDHRALLSREAFRKVAENVRTLWFRGLPKTCDVVIGVPATRLAPDTKQIWSELGIGRQAEKFMLRIRGRGEGQAPLITNYANAMSGGGQAILALTPQNDNQNFDALRDLMFATTAFPLVFAPQKLNYCIANPKSERWLHADYPLTCDSQEIESAEFLDGGLFDNQPIGIAEQISRSGLENENCGSTLREIPLVNSAAPTSNNSVLFIYLDNDLHEYPTEKPIESQNYLLPYLGSFVNSYINSSQSKDVLSSFEQDPSLQSQVAVAKNFYPRVSDHMFGFFGFLESDFRKFDFYLGMYEANQYFQNQIEKNLQAGNRLAATNLRFPVDETPDWKPYVCLVKFLNHQTANDCTDENSRILAALSLERLAALCAAYPNTNKKACALVADRDDTFRKGESDFGFSLRKLAQKDFQYKNLGLSAGEDSFAGPKLKANILNTINRLADAQPWPDNLAINAVGPVMINAIEHIPSEYEFYLSFGPALRTGFSKLVSFSGNYPPRLRLVADGQIASFSSWLGAGGVVVPSASGGFEYEIENFSSATLQSRLRILAGYQFHSDFTNAICTSGSNLDCRGGFLQPGLSLTFLERLRLGLDGNWFILGTSGPKSFGLIPSLGLQFYF